MRSFLTSARPTVWASLFVFAGAALDAGEPPRPQSTARPPATKAGNARGVLPDPALLDGSAHPPEKKSEHGMIGDFELPGDENVRNGRVGGQSNPNAPQGSQRQNQQQQMGLPNLPGLPQAGGRGGQQAAAGQGGQGAGGQQQTQNQGSGSNPIQGAGDPGAQAQGVQVAELSGAGGSQSDVPPSEKPPQVAIGDAAMKIPTQSSAAAAGVVGGQQLPGNTQHHEKGTGTGGKAPTGAQGNNRIERGRAIPSGL